MNKHDDDETKDPFLEQILDEAMVPYLGLLPSEQLAMLRRVLREEMLEDPVAMDLLKGARPRVIPDSSVERPVGEAEEAAPEEESPALGQVVPFGKRNVG